MKNREPIFEEGYVVVIRGECGIWVESVFAESSEFGGKTRRMKRAKLEAKNKASGFEHITGIFETKVVKVILLEVE